MNSATPNTLVSDGSGTGPLLHFLSVPFGKHSAEVIRDLMSESAHQCAQRRDHEPATVHRPTLSLRTPLSLCSLSLAQGGGGPARERAHAQKAQSTYDDTLSGAFAAFESANRHGTFR